MPRKGVGAGGDLEDVLRRIEESKAAFVDALETSDKDSFEIAGEDGESIKLTAQRAADEINFYYGRLVSRALNLPQPPLLTRADYGSVREAVAALHIAHRTFTQLLHDLAPEDLEKVADDPELGKYSLKQILELASAQYAMRAQQVGRLATAPSG